MKYLKSYNKELHRGAENTKIFTIMNYDPWDTAFKLCKGAYTREQIDEMLLCEIEEIIYQDDEL